MSSSTTERCMISLVSWMFFFCRLVMHPALSAVNSWRLPEQHGLRDVCRIRKRSAFDVGCYFVVLVIFRHSKYFSSDQAQSEFGVKELLEVLVEYISDIQRKTHSDHAQLLVAAHSNLMNLKGSWLYILCHPLKKVCLFFQCGISL